MAVFFPDSLAYVATSQRLMKKCLSMMCDKYQCNRNPESGIHCQLNYSEKNVI